MKLFNLRGKGKLLAAVAAFVIAASTCVPAKEAAESTVSLNLYDEDYEYNDESIAAVLNSTVVKVYYVSTAGLTYKPITISTSKLINGIVNSQKQNPDMDTQEIIDDTLSNITSYLVYDALHILQATCCFTGSGIVLSENGYIATNNHVVSATEDERKEAYINNLSDIIVENYSNIVSSIESIFGSGVLTEDQQTALQKTLVSAYLSNATINNEQIQIYVMYPGPNGEAEESSERTVEAEIVDTISGDMSVQDAAILKINANNLAALNFVDDYPVTGSKLWTGGYPGSADITDESVLTATITSGTVGAIKAEGSYNLIQTDAVISNGNSGGPSIDNKLNIIGLNTLGVNYEDYAYIIPFEIVEDIINKNGINIGMGDTSKTFLLGIQAMEQNYGKTALDCFNAVKALNPNLPYIQSLIDRAEKLPQDEMPTRIDFKLIAIIAGCVAAAILIIILIVAIVKGGKKKKTLASVNFDNVEVGGLMDGLNNDIDYSDGQDVLTDSNNFDNNYDSGDDLL